MSNWNYCHGPNCHTYHTQSRIRGVKGNKVLKTRKVSQKGWWNQEWGTKYWHFFCDDRCKHDFLDKHLRADHCTRATVRATRNADRGN